MILATSTYKDQKVDVCITKQPSLMKHSSNLHLHKLSHCRFAKKFFYLSKRSILFQVRLGRRRHDLTHIRNASDDR